MKWGYCLIIYLLFCSCLKETEFKINSDYPYGIRGVITNTRQTIQIVRISENNLNKDWTVNDAEVYLESSNGDKFRVDGKNGTYHSEYSLTTNLNWIIRIQTDDLSIEEKIDFYKPKIPNEFYGISSDSGIGLFFKVNDYDENFVFFESRFSNLISGTFNFEELSENNKIIQANVCRFNRNIFFNELDIKLKLKVISKDGFDALSDARNHSEDLLDNSFNFYGIGFKQNKNTKLLHNSTVNLLVLTELEYETRVEDKSKTFVSLFLKDSNGSNFIFRNNSYAILKIDTIYSEIQVLPSGPYVINHRDTLYNNRIEWSTLKSKLLMKPNCLTYFNVFYNSLVTFKLDILDGPDLYQGNVSFIIDRSPISRDVILYKK